MNATLRALLLLVSVSFYSVQSAHSQFSTTVSDFPYSEGFESSFGNWQGDIANPGWQRINTATGSGGTGPTSAFEGSYYVYTETSSGSSGAQNTTYILRGPRFALPSLTAPFFSFNYHMWGNSTGMGSFYLEIDISPGATFSADSILWSKTGDQGNAWFAEIIDLSEFAGDSIQLRFRALTGSGTNAYQGDRAIDNLYLSLGVDAFDETCAGNDGKAISTPQFSLASTPSYSFSWSNGASSTSQLTDTIDNLTPGTYTVTVTDNLSVSKVIGFSIGAGSGELINSFPEFDGFESGFSYFNNVTGDNFDWTINSGTTPSANQGGGADTGPNSANEGTFYAYTEVSGEAVGATALLESWCLDVPGSGSPWMSFDYHMYSTAGNTAMGNLYIDIDTDATTEGGWLSTPIWSKIGNQGDVWHSDTIDLSPYAGSTIKLRFRGVRGSGTGANLGDRAIDAITFSNGIIPGEISCPGASNGSLTVAAFFGTPPYTYSWSNSSTSKTISGLGAGTYTVTITDSLSSTEIISYQLISPSTPTPTNLSADTTSFCVNTPQTVQLSIDYISGDATFTGTSSTLNDLGPQNTQGQPISGFYIPNTPPFATDDGTLTIFYRGDMEAAGEYANTNSENGVFVGTANESTTQCATNFVAHSFTIPVDSINEWAQNDTVGFTAVPVGASRYCGTGANRFSLEAYYTLTYPYSTNRPYWFANNCDSVISNAVDSGFVVSLNPTVTTTYYVRFYNASCDEWGTCQSITITVNPQPTVTASPSSGNYCGTPVSISSSGASTYTWGPSTGLNTNTGANVLASPASNTTYVVTGTDANGCTNIATSAITVTSGPSASISSSSNVTCFGGNNGSATASASNTTGTVSYSWSNGATTAAVSSLSAGTYTVTVSDATSCVATASITITQPLQLGVTLVVNNALCSGASNGSITAVPNGGTGTKTYLWSNGQTSSAAVLLSAGTYTVTVTDANGCTVTDAATITTPALLTGSITSTTNVSCFGGNNGSATAAGSGGTPPYSYSWTGGGGSNATASNLAAGTYFVFIFDANGCSAGPFMTTITQPATAVSVSIASSSNVSCFGGSNGSATASASGGTGTKTYLWSNSATTASISSLTAGIYTVTATDANGCTATTSVTITQPAAITSTFTVTNVSCFGGSNGSATAVPAGGSGTYTGYAWSGGGTSATKSGLSAGTYTVTITDNNGCTGTASVTITQPSVLSASATVNNNVS
ncbi:MAG: hypothetical protein R2813_13085, partial [Flavobacteriales bacterium]